jgi:hypothetical protein
MRRIATFVMKIIRNSPERKKPIKPAIPRNSADPRLRKEVPLGMKPGLNIFENVLVHAE